MIKEKNETHIAIFNGKTIRRKLVGDKWFFSVVDVVNVLTDSDDPRKYWNKLIQRLREEGSEVVTFCHQLKLIAEDGKLRETDCADTEGIFRIIQSIPSRKAEPFKRWLARVGYLRNLHKFRFLMVQKFQTNTQEFFDERIQETEKESLLVSPEHRVYVGEENYNNFNSFIKLPVVSIPTLDCFLNAGSSDQIGDLSKSANAKYVSSLLSSASCGDILLASDKNFVYFDFGKVLIDLSNNENKNSNSDSSISENLIIRCLFSNNSFNTKSGEISSHSAFNNSSITYLLTDFDLKNENKIDASIINNFGSIFDYNLCFFATSLFTSFASSETCPSVNLLLDNTSSAIENSNLLINCLVTLANANSNLSLNSSGTSTLMQTSAINLENTKAYKKLSVDNFSLQKVTDVSSDIQKGREIYFLNEKNQRFFAPFKSGKFEDENNKPIKVKRGTF